MQEEQQNTHRPHFDPALFFPGNGRRDIREALKDAATDSACLITCIGEEGSGKTMLCKKVGEEFAEPYLVISFPYSVESFDYVLQIIAQKLHLDFSPEDHSAGSGHLLTVISRTLREQALQLLLLFDEAEKLYLATLERLRKMIDLVNEDGVLLQIILFGRRGLQAHIEQLALCTFKPTEERHLTLPPLTEEDTFQYLNFCMGEHPDFEGEDIFSREVAAKILAISHGDFRKINCLAADSLRSSAENGDNTDNTSFMVLLEHVRDTDAMPVKAGLAVRLSWPFMQKKTAFAMGALLLLLPFLLFLINKKAEEPAPPYTTDRPLLATQAAPQQDRAEQEYTAATQPVQPAPVVAAEAIETVQSPAPAPVIEKVPAYPVAATEVTAETVAAEPSPTPAPVTEPAQPAPVAPEKPAAESVSVTITPLVEKEAPEIQIVVADKLPKKNSLPLQIGPEPYIKNTKVLMLKKALKSTGTQNLPQTSLAAGDNWLVGKHNDRFTLQLMVLTADQAGEKLKRIVTEEAERSGAENFIVLRKSTSPTTFLLFYGVYSTLAAAREARDNLPPSLQKYMPYPVSIKQAVEKSKT